MSRRPPPPWPAAAGAATREPKAYRATSYPAAQPSCGPDVHARRSARRQSRAFRAARPEPQAPAPGCWSSRCGAGANAAARALDRPPCSRHLRERQLRARPDSEPRGGTASVDRHGQLASGVLVEDQLLPACLREGTHEARGEDLAVWLSQLHAHAGTQPQTLGLLRTGCELEVAEVVHIGHLREQPAAFD